jgi:FdrA protein
MSRHVELRSGSYHDSVTLMQVSVALRELAGVSSALVAMATELNLDLLSDQGFSAPAEATPADLMVAVDAADENSLQAALTLLESKLSERPAAGNGAAAAAPPLTVASAARRFAASLVLVSTPGAVAVADAMDALDAGLPVMVFSDNVSVDQEVALKQAAEQRGLLVMGPDCGTAVIGGIGLGFANVVRPGPVGMVAASGTGAQQLLSLLDACGVGVSHCIGVGGRDLSDAVAARSTLRGLDLLDADEGTELILLVSKPPGASTAALVRDHAATLAKPCVVALLGAGQPDLTAVAAQTVEAAGATWTSPPRWPAEQSSPAGGVRGPFLRGLFAGGTLCDEAMLIASAQLGDIASNIPLRPELALAPDLAARGHTMIDFGDDRLTAGRPHPMIDATLRIERLRTEAADPDCGVLLLDVVLGHCAHPDPAGQLAPAIADAITAASSDGRELSVVVTLVGTRGDPQDLGAQQRALSLAGAVVHLSNAEATREAVALVAGARR